MRKGKVVHSKQTKIFDFSFVEGGNYVWPIPDQGSLKIVNQPADSFLIWGIFIDNNKQLFVMGYLVKKSGDEGVIYKV